MVIALPGGRMVKEGPTWFSYLFLLTLSVGQGAWKRLVDMCPLAANPTIKRCLENVQKLS